MAQWHTVVNSAEEVASETGALLTTALQAESLGVRSQGVGWCCSGRAGIRGLCTMPTAVPGLRESSQRL